MVDTQTWNGLDDADRQEFRRLFGVFQESLRRNGLHDGSDLSRDWSVALANREWVISNGTTILGGVTSERRNVIEALFADGVQNLNR